MTDLYSQNNLGFIKVSTNAALSILGCVPATNSMNKNLAHSKQQFWERSSSKATKKTFSFEHSSSTNKWMTYSSSVKLIGMVSKCFQKAKFRNSAPPKSPKGSARNPREEFLNHIVRLDVHLYTIIMYSSLICGIMGPLNPPRIPLGIREKNF